MFKFVFDKTLLMLYYMVSALVIEAVTFSILSAGFMPEYFWYNFAIIFFVAILVYAIPNYTAQYIVYSIILVAQIVFAYVNYSLRVIYADVFSIEMLKLTGEAFEAITANFIYVTVILQLLAVALGVLICGALLLKFCKKDKINVKQHFSVFNVIILIVCQCLSVGYFVNKREVINSTVEAFDSEYVETDAFLMNTNIMKPGSYKKFGTYGYFVNLLFNKFGNYDKRQIDSAIAFFDGGEIYDDSDSDVFGTANLDESTKGKENVIVIMMESLEWFAFGDGNYDYEVNNLSNELTPNIYNLINSNRTMIAKNFFAKSKTNYSESIGIMGSYPTGSSLDDIAGKKYDTMSNAFGYTMPNVLKNEGYTTTYVHSNVLQFYNRNETHQHLGFDNLVGKESVKDDEGNNIYSGDELSWNHWAAEGDFARNVIDSIIPYDPSSANNDPFYTFYLTVSTHGGYEYSENEEDCMRYRDYVMYGPTYCAQNAETKRWELKDEYKSKCVFDADSHKWVIKANETGIQYTTWYQNVLTNYSADIELVDLLLYYECGVCGLDEAIGVIVQQLKDYNIYDNTTLMLYADHYSYYEDISNRFKEISTSDRTNVELNTIPFIISSNCLSTYAPAGYTRDKTYLEYDRFCSAYDTIPTIFDLLGIKFNENLYPGSSLFSTCDYIYTLDGTTRDMVVYYSNTGGLYSRDISTLDMAEFTTTNYVADKTELISTFKSASKVLLNKLNYLQIMHTYGLYSSIKPITD